MKPMNLSLRDDIENALKIKHKSNICNDYFDVYWDLSPSDKKLKMIVTNKAFD